MSGQTLLMVERRILSDVSESSAPEAKCCGTLLSAPAARGCAGLSDLSKQVHVQTR